MEVYTYKKGQLVEFNNLEWINQNNHYRRGVYKFDLDYIPKCKICGSELSFIKKGNYLIIDHCLNHNCETNNINLKKSAPIKWKAFLPDFILEEKHQKQIQNNSFNIDFLIKKGYSKEEAIEYINKQKEINKTKGSKNKGKNKEYYINKLGKDEYYNKLRKRNYLCIEYWINKGYSEEEGKKKISEIQIKNSKKVHHYGITTKEYYKEKGIEDVDLFMKEKSKFCIEYYLKRGYSKEEGLKEISKIQLKNNSKVKNHKSNRQIQYWINKGYSIDESKKIISKLQCTFSKEKCIEKYGEIEGLKVFRERQRKWQETLKNQNSIKVGYSKISQELFKNLLRFYKPKERVNIFYATKNKEFCIYDNKNYLYDFVDIKNKKIIEFQGDVYHANPKLYTNENYIHPYDIEIKAQDIWNKDLEKKKIAEKNGFKLIYIWEFDYRNNKEEQLNICKKFLNLNG